MAPSSLFGKTKGCQPPRHGKRGPPPSYGLAWRRERGTTPPLICHEIPRGRQHKLPDLYSMGCPLYLLKEANYIPIISSFTEKNQIKKVEDSYEIKIYFFKIIGFLF